jgi:hypothetical protein
VTVPLAPSYATSVERSSSDWPLNTGAVGRSGIVAVCPQLARPTETIATAAAATVLMRVVILMTFLQTSFIVYA